MDTVWSIGHAMDTVWLNILKEERQESHWDGDVSVETKSLGVAYGISSHRADSWLQHFCV